MKVFRFTPYSGLCKEKDSLSKFDKVLINKETSKTSHLSPFKKHSSLDNSSFHNRQKYLIQAAYREKSQKKQRCRSKSTQKNCYFTKIPFKAIQSKVLSCKKQNNQTTEKKLSLHSESKSKFKMNELSSYFQFLLEKLKQSLHLKSEKLFLDEYRRCFDLHKQFSQGKEDYVVETLRQLMSSIQACEERKNEHRMKVFYDSVSRLQKEKENMSIQNKKMKIKLELVNSEITVINTKNNELMKKLKLFQDKKDLASVEVQTMDAPKLQDKSNQEDKPMPMLIQQIRNLRAKEKQMNMLIYQMKKQNIDLEKIYQRALCNNNKMSEDESSSEQQSSTGQWPLNNESAQQKPSQKRKKQKGETEGRHEEEYDADNSIVEDLDALSFNYQDKEPSMEEYTPRRVYECNKIMDESLKKKLELDFNCLYQEESAESSQRNQAFPTI